MLIHSNRPVAKIDILSLEDGKPIGVTIQSPISQHDAPSGCDVLSEIVLASVRHRERNKALQRIRLRCGDNRPVNPATRRRELNKTFRQNLEPPREQSLVIEQGGVPAHVVRPSPAKLASEKQRLADELAASLRQPRRREWCRRWLHVFSERQN